MKPTAQTDMEPINCSVKFLYFLLNIGLNNSYANNIKLSVIQQAKRHHYRGLPADLNCHCLTRIDKGKSWQPVQIWNVTRFVRFPLKENGHSFGEKSSLYVYLPLFLFLLFCN